jgi:hypothetical protein
LATKNQAPATRYDSPGDKSGFSVIFGGKSHFFSKITEGNNALSVTNELRTFGDNRLKLSPGPADQVHPEA